MSNRMESMPAEEPQTFPDLPTSDILECLQSLQISCSQDDLVHPTTIKLWPIYESFLELLVGENASKLVDPFSSDQLGAANMGPANQFQILEILEHPGLHQESLTLMSFYRKV